MFVRSKIPRAMGLLAAVAASVALVFAAAPAQAETPSGNTSWNGYVHYWTVNGKAAYQDTEVQAQWQVPQNSCGTGDADDAIWIGLGGLILPGASATPLVQIGTNTLCFGGHQYNFGVWQVVANDGTPIEVVPYSSYPLYTGDHMFAAVDYDGNGLYEMFLYDDTQSWYFSYGYTVSDTRLADTAEWIVEAPSISDVVTVPILNKAVNLDLALSDFGTAHINYAQWAQSGYAYAPTSSNGSYVFEADNPEQTEVSALTGGGDNTTDFTVTWENSF